MPVYADTAGGSVGGGGGCPSASGMSLGSLYLSMYGGGFDVRNGLTGNGRLLKFNWRNAGPRYCEHSLEDSGEVTFPMAPTMPQMNHTGFDILLSTNTPLAAPVRRSQHVVGVGN